MAENRAAKGDVDQSGVFSPPTTGWITLRTTPDGSAGAAGAASATRGNDPDLDRTPRGRGQEGGSECSAMCRYVRGRSR